MECGVWRLGCKVYSVECKVWSVECKVWKPGKVKVLVGMKSEQKMWGKREPLEERKRMGTGSEVRIVMQVFQVVK